MFDKSPRPEPTKEGMGFLTKQGLLAQGTASNPLVGPASYLAHTGTFTEAGQRHIEKMCSTWMKKQVNDATDDAAGLNDKGPEISKRKPCSTPLASLLCQIEKGRLPSDVLPSSYYEHAIGKAKSFNAKSSDQTSESLGAKLCRSPPGKDDCMKSPRSKSAPSPRVSESHVPSLFATSAPKPPKGSSQRARRISAGEKEKLLKAEIRKLDEQLAQLQGLISIPKHYDGSGESISKEEADGPKVVEIADKNENQGLQESIFEARTRKGELRIITGAPSKNTHFANLYGDMKEDEEEEETKTDEDFNLVADEGSNKKPKRRMSRTLSPVVSAVREIMSEIAASPRTLRRIKSHN